MTSVETDLNTEVVSKLIEALALMGNDYNDDDVGDCFDNKEWLETYGVAAELVCQALGELRPYGPYGEGHGVTTTDGEVVSESWQCQAEIDNGWGWQRRCSRDVNIKPGTRYQYRRMLCWQHQKMDPSCSTGVSHK